MSLVEKFNNSADAKFLIARWEHVPAGSLAFGSFDELCGEMQHFYVDASFRGLGIGRQLMQSALTEIAQGSRRRVLIHTTPYMTHAVAIYEEFGFRPCSRFRDTPEHIRHTDVFMDRPINSSIPKAHADLPLSADSTTGRNLPEGEMLTPIGD
ncbi:GNAT family N-acetyltransferase [Mesorhizobium sp. B4-1-1]|nr:GNAT family N-acetyltransferase [Mesorhizobium sp. B4-1-1]